MLTLFWIFALSGSLFLVIQMLLLLLGMGDNADGDIDVDADIDADADLDLDAAGGFDFPFFTLKSFTGFVGGFGWGGLIIFKYYHSPIMAIGGGLIAGIILALCVSTMIYLMTKLKHSGNLNIQNAIGKTGTVYLVIPANLSGTGIVQVVVQDSLREMKAMTKGDKILTGKRIKIIDVDGDIVIVEEVK
ncbi:MAG: hypothetical protein K9N06_12295 [Candidatus Cloacimonetes bacterium]|nr:hypothetical protein [Candidatus Cloacimonadota bacterium]